MKRKWPQMLEPRDQKSLRHTSSWGLVGRAQGRATVYLQGSIFCKNIF